ncbi:Conserved_hypothetical protein [Hexamita inflata]|uniref:Uncharacterized protein n=1 Tax=Hexamita inflata TaxID=28002 RepID=A0AA86PB68_9EUKA|nr:Conserved hypothetical protein [Hexamita inflata]
MLDVMNCINVVQAMHDIQNISVFDSAIQSNISALQQNFTPQIIRLNITINDIQTQYQQNVKQMQDIVTNLTQQINCINVAGIWINGSCYQNSCQVQGQININGTCQCANANAVVQNNTCVCPKFSTLLGSVCTCPDNSKLIQDVCTCINQEQTIQQGICSCSTAGALVVNGFCSCGVDAYNISNTCGCPSNSNLINGICTCSIIGQTIQSGECICPSGQTVASGSCQTVIFINSSDIFQCSQSVFITSFDIQAITNQLATPLSFGQYQIFASSNIITNAFIDICDNVIYSTSINPLFQSQNSFTNIKIQFGVQVVTSGSILTPATSVLKIVQMNIISKTGSQIYVSSFINIIAASSQNSSINKLLVNLSFSRSSGNITLINTVTCLNITGYQILGAIQSTNTVAMISLNLNSTTIINNVCFKPTVFTVGNCSSYLFNSVNSVFLTLSDIGIIIGDSSNQVLAQIASNSTFQFQFG